MTPDEKELRRALEARGGSPSSEFRARLSQSLRSRPATPNLMPAVALATAVLLTVTSVGILLASRGLQRHEGPASSGRVTSPTPTSVATPSPPSSVVLSAPSANVVWALVDNQHLYRSTDQGKHWEQRIVFAGPFRSASFIDDHEGWILDAGSAATQCQPVTPSIGHTVDGGLTWQQLPAKGIGAGQCVIGIWFFDARHGFVSAWDRGGQPAVYRTSDGGNTFAATTLPDPPYFRPQTGVASSSRAAAFTLQTAWMKQFGSTYYLEAVGSQNDPNLPRDNQFVLKSTDGGASWSLVTKVPSQAVVMVTESRWLDYTSPGHAMESVNGGQQFHQFTSDFNLAATQLVFADANVGYAVGLGVAQQTTNGGAHWIRLAAPGTAPPTPSPSPPPSGAKLSAPSANVVWSLVDGQQLYRSTDQGNTWVQRTTPPTAVKGGSPLISFVDATTGWELVPTSGDADCKLEAAEIWRTTDGAATWERVSVTQSPAPAGTVPVERCKDALSFADSMNGFLTLGDPTFEPELWQTMDGGATWQGLLMGFPSPDNTRPRRVFTMKAFGAGLVGEAKFEALSFVWSEGRWVNAPDHALSDVAFLTPTHWLILEPNALETTDAGQTWHNVTADYSTAAGVATNFVFANEMVGYATVGREVHRTTDGGGHWEMIKNSWP